MNKKGQEQYFQQPKPKSTFVVKLIGFLLIFVSLSWLIQGSTSEWVFLALAGISFILAIFSLKTGRKFALFVSIILTLLLVALYFLEFVSDFLIIFADILTNKYVLPVFLLLSAVTLLIVGTIWYKIVGLFLFVALILNAAEFLIDFNDIFSFLEPLLKYDISISWPVLFILGFLCLFGGGGIKRYASAIGGAGTQYGGGLMNPTQKRLGWIKKMPGIAEKRQEKADYLRAQRQARDSMHAQQRANQQRLREERI